MQDHCQVLRTYFLLDTAEDALKCQNSTFIKDRQDLESLLGQSQDSWFESLTAQHIQCQKSSSIKSRYSVVDSPTCTPTLSQLIHGQLPVGPSPTGLRHSSPAPYCEREESFNARLSLGTPQSDRWERPLLDFSPGPSPIIQNKSVLSYPSSSGVYSLGLDDSNLSWTNSLATPPRNQSQTELLVSEVDASSARTKDTARALFSPGGSLDTTGDSVLPLDSTFEEEQSDLNASKADQPQSTLTQSDKNGNQTIRETSEAHETRSTPNIPLSQEVSTKADILEQSLVKDMCAENLKGNVKKRLSGKQDILTESSKKFKSKNRNSFAGLNGNDISKSVKNGPDSKSVKDNDKNKDLQDFSSSPTFSQRSSHSKVKGRKSPRVSSRCERSSIDDVLSDFFDPPAASVGRRKPAPSRKRKSLEMEETISSDIESAAEVSCDRSGSALNLSTPKGTLQSILTSDKKAKTSSTKKVRFSDNVKKCTFIPEQSTSLERRADKKSLNKKRPSAKSLKNKEERMSKNSKTSDSVNERYMHKGNDSQTVSEIAIKSPIKHENTKKNKKESMMENNNGPLKSIDDRLCNQSKCPEQNRKTQSGVLVRSNTDKNQSNKSENQELKSGTGHKIETGNMVVSSVKEQLDDNSEEELFSQVSQSALNEMCNVAEKPVTCEENAAAKTDNRDNIEKPVKPVKAKRFFYPSVSHIGGTSSKVFQYKENETKNLNKKVLLSSVKVETVLDEDLDKSVDTHKHAKEMGEHLPVSAVNMVVEKENFHQNIVIGQVKADGITDESRMSPSGSTTKNVPLDISCDQQFTTVCGFQSAAGRPVSIPKQAMEKAATLLLEEGKDKIPELKQETMCSPVKLSKNVTSLQENKHTEAADKVQDDNKDITKGEICSRNYHSGVQTLKGFQSASGKTLNITAEAVEKAASVFSEDIQDSKSGLDMKSNMALNTDITANNTVKSIKSVVGLQSGPSTDLGVPAQASEKDALSLHVDKSATDFTKPFVDSKGFSTPGRSSNMCKGFQLASGKDILVPEQALEKAASLLEEESKTFKPHCDIQVTSKSENVVDMKNESGIEDAFIEDIEFSEWYEEMEPDESFHLETENKFVDLKNDLSDSEMPERQISRRYESNEHELDTKNAGVSVNSGTEIHRRKLELMETLNKDMDKPKKECNFDKLSIGKHEDQSNGTIPKPAVDGPLEDDNSVCAYAGKDQKNETELNVNNKTVNESRSAVYDQSEQSFSFQNSKCMGFQTASGKSVAFSEEKLKHAEKLLNDTDNNVTPTLNIPTDFDEKNKMMLTAKTVFKANKPLLDSKEERETNSNLAIIQSRALDAEVPVATCKLEHTSGRESGIHKLKEHVGFSDKAVKSGEGLEKNTSKRSDKMSVAERLKLEFENDLVVDGIHANNSKCFEDELKDLEDLKRNGKEKIEKEKYVTGQVETTNKSLSAEANVPKGFRPFKPPKITRNSSHEKYPQSVMNDWACTKQPHTDMASTETVTENSVRNCEEIVNKSNLKRATNQTITYSESKSKHWRPDKEKDLALDDKIQASTISLAETDSNTIKSESFENSDIKDKIVSDATSVSIDDLQGMSQMFEDDMEFTQMESVDMNESLNNENVANSNKEEEITSHNKHINTTKDRETLQQYGSDKTKSKPETGDLKPNLKDKLAGNKTNFIGFSTASGRSLSISETALESAEKLLSKCDEGKSIQDSLQSDMSNAIYKKVMNIDITEDEIMTSKGSISGHSSNIYNENSNVNGVKKFNCEMQEVALSDQYLSADEVTGNIKSEISDQNCSQNNTSGMRCSTINESLICTMQTNYETHVISSSTEELDVKAHGESRCETSEGIVCPDIILEHKLIKPDGFKIASGTPVGIYETALKDARKSLNRNVLEKTCEDDLLQEKEQMPSLCLFQTAIGKLVHISQDALKVAKQTLDGDNKEMKKNVSDGDGELSKTSSDYVVPECSRLDITGNSRSYKSNSVPVNDISEKTSPEVVDDGHLAVFCGFSTASGKKVEVSETALKNAQSSLEDDVDLNAKDESYSSSSAERIEVSIPEKALKVANAVFSSSLEENKTCSKEFCDLSTDSGENNKVSEKSLEYAKSTFISERATEKADTKFPGLITASGNRVEVSETAFNHAKQKLSETDEFSDPASETKFAGFSSASGHAGNRVQVSETALKHAKQQLSEAESLNHQGSETKFAGFSTASGNRVKVSETALKHAKQQLSESDDFNDPGSETKFAGFSTTSGNRVKVSETALKHAKQQLSESNDFNDPGSETKFAGFSTASGNRVKVSETALKHAKQQLSETDNLNNQGSETKFAGFSTASGNRVKVSETALKHAKQQLSESDDFNDPGSETKFAGFSTTSGNRVKVSETALKHAKQQLSESNDFNDPGSETKFAGFSTASGNRVKVSETALKHAKQQLSESDDFNDPGSETKFAGFSTASGNRVKVSETALKHAKQQLSETDNLNNQGSETKFAGFSTASGNRVKVSETALKHAKQQLSETDNLNNQGSETKFAGFSTASGNRVEVSETALKHAKQQLSETDNLNNQGSETKFAGFSTASGNRVEVSETALKHAKQQLSSETKFAGFSAASENRVEVSETALKHAKQQLSETDNLNHPGSETKFAGFSTASGNRVEVSETALKHAKQQVSETNNLNHPGSETKFAGFSTASGNRVEVSETALKHAKQQLSETSGNIVEVSEKAFKHVKGHLLETDSLSHPGSETKFASFSTASGKTVEVSDSALKLATDSLNENHTSDEGIIKSDKLYTSEFFDRISNQVDDEMADLGKPEAEIGETDFEEMFGMALKRRKLDMNRESKTMHNMTDEGSTSKRKAVKSAPKGDKDQRHPGFRPFKPVFCKAPDKQQERLEVLAVKKHNSITTKPIYSEKSSFIAPYKNTPEKSNVSADTITSTQQVTMVTAHVYKPKSLIDSNLGQGDGVDIKSDIDMTYMSASGDHIEKSAIRAKEGSQIQHTSAKSDLTGNDSEEVLLSGVRTKQEKSNFIQELSAKHFSNERSLMHDGIPKYENSVSIKADCGNVEAVVNSDVLETAQVSDNGEFDSFSQDEDDVYYCTLVESRRHQDDIIKQRAADRVRPAAGRLWKMKQAQNRWKLKDLVDNLAQDMHKTDVHVTSESSMNHKFSMESYYGRNTANVLVGDGGYLVPDDAGKIGKQEFYRAFLTMERIDAKLISEAWIYNHYRWIVWKLAAYEKTSTCLRARCLTPEMVMLQLKYRYDREVDLSQRSAIKKIYERDDTPSKRLVLCVAAVKGNNPAGSSGDQSKPGLDEKVPVILEVTDGWYSIPAQIDPPLTHLVLKGKINIGDKLCVTGAELVGGDDACTPLEAPSSVMLRICRNSTRPAPWDSILGYQSDPRPLCVPLSDLHSDGGIVGVMDVVIVRKYQTMYMEKFEGGGCIFRTSRCEDRARQEYESKKQSEMEKLYRQMENTADKEQKHERRVKQRKKYSRTDIENFQSGQEMYEAMEEAAQPDMVQNYLSEQQLGMLYEYQRQIQEQKQFDLNSRLQKAWQEKLEVFPERVVTPVLKFRVAGCANRDLDQNASTILTVWRPAPEIADMQEGHRYKIYSLSSSVSRSKYTGHTVQLTATKQTRFRRMQLDENILDRIYEPREVLWVSDVKRRQPPYGELDFVGVVVKIAESTCSERMCDTVYLADCQTGILALRFWNGYKSFGEDLFLVGSALCCSNLMDKALYRNMQIPTVEVSPEFTHITNRSQNPAQRKALDKLLAVSKDKAGFIEKANTVLDQLQNENISMNIPKRIHEITDDFINTFPKRNDGRQSLNSCQTGSKEHNEKTGMDNDNCTIQYQHPRNNLQDENIPIVEKTSCMASETKSTSAGSEMSNCDGGKINVPSSDPTVVSTPVTERKRSIAQAKMARLTSYGSPSVLSPLSITVPRSVTKGFKPPAFKKL